MRFAAAGAVAVRTIIAGALLAMGACAAPEAPKPVELAYPPPPEEPRYFYERTLFGSRDVAPETAADRLRRFATGESERGRGFAKPYDVEAVEGRIFVSDTVNRRVAVLDLPQQRYYEIGTSGIGRLIKPLGLATDQVGHLYVVDGTAKRVHVYDLEGGYVRSIGTGEILQRPTGVAVSADGSRIYVVDTGGVTSKDHGIRVFGPDGTHLFNIGTRGKEEGQFNLPLMAAMGPNGRLHVVDTGNFRVQVFDRDGKFLFSFGRAGRQPGQFSHPKGIAIDRDGKIFVTDSGFANFQIFSPQGQVLMFIGTRDERGGPGEYLLPAGISVDADGRIYFVDQFFRKIDVFRPADLPPGAPVGKAPDQSVSSEIDTADAPAPRAPNL
ncbi:MAG: 6-bladed beta-propeller [Alphaproteobacteria bacterium]|nr:MAG: 6-bladed beta-propeller [Alphaproteobacteria bacterium]